jgi:hypothetical protein
MAYTAINKSSDFFNTILYTGNGSNNHTITGVGFNTDFAWIKNRGGDDHRLFNQVTGINKYLKSNSNTGQITDAILTTNSDGYVVTNAGEVNANNGNFVGWNWKAGTTSGLSGGSITPTAYSINASSGFGIYTWTGNSTSGASIAHGLGKVPKMIIVKRLTNAASWQVYHQSMGNGKWIEMDSNQPQQTGTSRWNDTSPTSTLFYLGNDSDVNNSSYTYVAYVFCDVPGFSKMGAYTGNANNDASAPFIYTGFKPSFVMLKSYNQQSDWIMFDNKRNPYNVTNTHMYANNNSGDDTSTNYNEVDFLSNGIKIREDNTTVNGDGYGYLYMCFGQSVVGSNNIPATAR